MTDPRCGSPAGYQEHRRRGTDVCPPCHASRAVWMRHYRARVYLNRGKLMVDATGTRRRLQALARIGWSAPLLGERLGISGSAVNNMMRRCHDLIRRDTARRVATLYDELWDRPGPSKRVADHAARKGWPPPMAYDDETINDPGVRPSTGLERDGAALDEIAMERAMYDAAVPLRPAERAEVVRRLTRAGLSAAQIAQRLDTTPRSVTRWRGKAAS